MSEEKKFIDANRIDWRVIIPTNATIAEENMIYRARKLVESQPTADVVEKSKYDKLKENYDRLLESANILAKAVREYQKREEEENGN